MRYFKNTSWLFVERILRMILGIFISIWIARYLGPEQFGLFSYAQSFVALFSSIATLGLDTIVVRELLKYPKQESKFIGSVFILKLFGAILTLFVLFVATNLTSNDNYINGLIFIIASSTVFQAFNVVDIYFQAKVMSKYVVFVNSFSLFISSLVKIYFILNEAPLETFAYMVLFDSFILSLGFIYIFFKKSKFKLNDLSFSSKIAFLLLRDSWSLIFASIAASIYMKIDQIMIKEIMNSKSVGYYSVAVKMSEIWLAITIVLTKSLAPSITNAKKVDRVMYLDRIQLMYNMLVKISVVISIIVYIFSNEIIILLYGDNYYQSVEVLNLYIWSIIFVFLSNGSWSYYINEGLHLMASFRLIVGAIINIVLNIYFINYFGLLGAVYSTIISYAISSYFINYFYKKTRVNFIMQSKAFLNIFNLKTWLNPITQKGV